MQDSLKSRPGESEREKVRKSITTGKNVRKLAVCSQIMDFRQKMQQIGKKKLKGKEREREGRIGRKIE